MKFAVNPNPTIQVKHIGLSREPILIIDDFLTAPEHLVENASASPDWRDLPPGGYPGRRAALPGDYVRKLLRQLDPEIRAKLLKPNMKLDRFECAFSMVTQPPTDLANLQRLPHIDIADQNRVAILHYLCSSDFGGTAYFRQLETGLEQIGSEQKQRYLQARAADVKRLESDNAYPTTQTPGYEQIGHVDARFNRVIAYRSFTLHSGIIDNPERLSKDPKQGRLTANFFVDYKPT